MFCPALGIPEDPVSGNAHAMLAIYLLEAALLSPADPGFVGWQGARLGRPGRVEVRWDLAAGRPAAVRIGGHAVIIGEGTLAV
jgi:PhzF family phenazine biosynthesis protein